MDVYFVKDNDPDGGFLDVFLDDPRAHVARRVTVTEIREGQIPDDVWTHIMDGTIVHDPEKWWDEIYQPYFDKATVLWTRKGGFVNGTE